MRLKLFLIFCLCCTNTYSQTEMKIASGLHLAYEKGIGLTGEIGLRHKSHDFKFKIVNVPHVPWFSAKWNSFSFLYGRGIRSERVNVLLFSGFSSFSGHRDSTFNGGIPVGINLDINITRHLTFSSESFIWFTNPEDLIGFGFKIELRPFMSEKPALQKETSAVPPKIILKINPLPQLAPITSVRMGAGIEMAVRKQLAYQLMLNYHLPFINSSAVSGEGLVKIYGKDGLTGGYFAMGGYMAGFPFFIPANIYGITIIGGYQENISEDLTFDAFIGTRSVRNERLLPVLGAMVGVKIK